MYYSAFGMLSLTLYIIININLIRVADSAVHPRPRVFYRLLVFVIMAYFITDIIWGIVYEKHLITAAYFDTNVYFLSMALSVMLWTKFGVSYLNNNNLFDKLLTYTGWLMLLFVVSCLVVNFFVPILFMFDEYGKYMPLPGRYLFLGIQIFLFLVTSIYTFIIATRSTGSERRHHLTISIAGIVMTVFIALQTEFPLLPFYAIGCLVSSSLIHSFVAEDERIENAAMLGSAKLVEKELKERLALQEKLYEQVVEKHRADAVIRTLATEYQSVYYVDMEKDEAVCYRCDGRLNDEVKVGALFPFHIMFLTYIGNYVVEEYRNGFCDFIDFEHLRSELKEKNYVDYSYRSTVSGRQKRETIRFSKIRDQEDDKNAPLNAVCAGFISTEL